MEIIRRETDYALRCLLHLGRLEGTSLASVKIISEKEKLPYELLRKVFQRMTKSGILESIRGKHGGFRLARPPSEITIGHVLDAVQGPVVVNRCVSKKHCCPNKLICRFHKGICTMQEQITDLLNSSTLQDFLDQDESDTN